MRWAKPDSRLVVTEVTIGNESNAANDDQVETWTPEHRKEDVDVDALDSTYDRARGTDSPTFTWNDLGDGVLILSVGNDYSVVSLLTAGTWFYLRGSESEGQAEVTMAGQPATVPKALSWNACEDLKSCDRPTTSSLLRPTAGWSSKHTRRHRRCLLLKAISKLPVTRICARAGDGAGVGCDHTPCGVGLAEPGQTIRR